MVDAASLIDAGREAHLSGNGAAALMAQAGELFSEPPSIRELDVLVAKLPGSTLDRGAFPPPFS